MKTGGIISTAMIAMVFMNGCTSDKIQLDVSSGGNPNANVSYSNDIRPIIQTYCYGQGTQLCHVTNTNQGSSGDFTTYQGLKEKVDKGLLQLRVFTSNGGMPPAYSMGPKVLAPDDLQKLKDWVAEGAPDN